MKLIVSKIVQQTEAGTVTKLTPDRRSSHYMNIPEASDPADGQLLYEFPWNIRRKVINHGYFGALNLTHRRPTLEKLNSS